MTYLQSNNLYQRWIDAYEAKRRAQEVQYAVEELILNDLEFNKDKEGVQNFDDIGYKIKITGKKNRKVDGDKIQRIANAAKDKATKAHLLEQLSILVRWKPELNLDEYKKADEEVLRIFAPAITETPAKPTFHIERKE